MFETVSGSPDPPPAAPSLATVSTAIDEVVELQRQVDALEARRLAAVARAGIAAERAESALLVHDDVELGRAGAGRRRDLARRAFTADLATALRLTEQAAAHLVDTAHTLAVRAGEAGHATLDGLRQGRLSLAHATAIADTLAELPTTEARALVEAGVLPRAAACTVPQLRRHLRRARDLAHPEPFVERHRRAVESRAVYVDPGADGMAWLTALLPAHAAHAAHDRLTVAGRRAQEAGDPRTLAQLRADAVADLLLTGTDDGTDGGVEGQGSVPDLAEIARRITPTVRVTVPMLSLLGASDAAGDLDGHGPVDAATASTLTAGAPSLRRLLVDPVNGSVLTIDPGTYTVPAALRDFLRARDGVCRFPGCTRAAARCDVDHVVAWSDGGRTVANNLAHLCRHHHVIKHQSTWHGVLGPDGTLTWTSPTGREHHDPPAELTGPDGSGPSTPKPSAPRPGAPVRPDADPPEAEAPEPWS
ncbi:DUF222 domain-containing protein [Isoptericola sp. NPDC058082]|uniref:HNH endonuclease signature motif containing protein n=1 Tax=Isoptericola sp. NPDC058082 TaxID=3346331 RepID=UPI0036F02CD3